MGKATLRYLEPTTELLNLVILAHSIWHFSNLPVLREMLATTAGRVEAVLIAKFTITTMMLKRPNDEYDVVAWNESNKVKTTLPGVRGALAAGVDMPGGKTEVLVYMDIWVGHFEVLRNWSIKGLVDRFTHNPATGHVCPALITEVVATHDQGFHQKPLQLTSSH